MNIAIFSDDLARFVISDFSGIDGVDRNRVGRTRTIDTEIIGVLTTEVGGVLLQRSPTTERVLPSKQPLIHRLCLVRHDIEEILQQGLKELVEHRVTEQPAESARRVVVQAVNLSDQIIIPFVNSTPCCRDEIFIHWNRIAHDLTIEEILCKTIDDGMWSSE